MLKLNLKQLIKDKNINKKDIYSQLDLSPNYFNKLIEGKIGDVPLNVIEAIIESAGLQMNISIRSKEEYEI